MQTIKEKLDAAKIEIEHAERGYDLNKAAELKYAVIPKLQVRPCVLLFLCLPLVALQRGKEPTLLTISFPW